MSTYNLELQIFRKSEAKKSLIDSSPFNILSETVMFWVLIRITSAVVLKRNASTNGYVKISSLFGQQFSKGLDR